jgi:hypothetical protein
VGCQQSDQGNRDLSQSLDVGSVRLFEGAIQSTTLPAADSEKKGGEGGLREVALIVLLLSTLIQLI